MKILITGGNGFLGGSLVEHLKFKHEVFTTVRYNKNKSYNHDNISKITTINSFNDYRKIFSEISFDSNSLRWYCLRPHY